MRRFLTTSFIILALVISAAGSAPAAHAAGIATEGQGCDSTDTTEGGTAVCEQGLFCMTTGGGTTFTCQKSSADNHGQTQAQKDAAAKTVLDKNRTENASWGLNFVVSWIVKLFAWLVGVAALTLNYSVTYNVVGMGQYVKGLTAIGTVWHILRDIGNIMLIFGFLAIGISYIIDSDWYGGGKKLLPMLLIAAIFTNFSLFAAEAVIDVGNLFATQIYKQINGGTLPVQSTGFIGVASDLANERISTLILNKVGLQTIFGEGKEVNTKIFEAGNSWLISFMAIILFIITAFVMFTLAFILISRFIVLILLIMVSPIGVAGLAVPGLKSWADKWWHTLFQQTITAPILLLMLYIALSVIADEKFLTGFGTTSESGWVGWITGTSNLGGLASMLLSFLIAMGLLLAVVYFAKTLSAVGAGWATKTAGKLSFGATAFGMRSTAGWGANRAAKYLRSTAIGRVPLIGTGAVRGLERVATSNFDVRGATIGGGLKGIGVDAGATQKGGYKADLKARIESRTKYASELKGRELTDDEKVDQKMAQTNVKATEKRLADAQVRQKSMVAEGRNTQHVDEEITTERELLTKYKTKLDNIESVTDKGAQRKYASNLELGRDSKGTFNKYFNFAANTEAAKAIRKEAKKSTDDKTLDALKKAIKKVGGEEEEKEKKEEPKPETPKP